VTHPKTTLDLALAPVSVAIDENLQYLRDMPRADFLEHLELLIDRPVTGGTREQREKWVLRAALHQVNLHGWQAEVTPDGARIHLSGGSVPLDLGLGADIEDYICNGS
jgi:hypothetical protein